MIGNRFNGDNIAVEFQRILEERSLAKKAQALFESEASDPVEEFLNPPVDEESASDAHRNLGPEDFLIQSEMDDGVVSSSLDGNIKAMDAASGGGQIAHDSLDYFDAAASHILTGLGKIAGSLKSKGHNFAADIVQATAISIQDDFVKKASRKISVTTELTKMAKELSESGNQMASDMVHITIDRIKKSAEFDDDMTDHESMERGREPGPSEDMCEECEKNGEMIPGIGYSKQDDWLCAKHLEEAAGADTDYGTGTSSGEDDFSFPDES